jgi:(E)-4-hydroxy-3-methylbut-2-enyl-diphosphate synthase
MEAARALKEIKKGASIPVIADIHFHHELAIESLKSGVDCLRLNPGNIRDEGKVKEVVQLAKQREVPIRIGVNFGSLPPVGAIGKTRGLNRHDDGVNLLTKGGIPGSDYTAVDHMVATGLWEIDLLENLDFDLIKISLKAFDIDTTVEAYRRMSKLIPYPLHLGITEAGTARSGSIRSAIGLGILLYEGIGDTIRVSLSDNSTEEVITGFEVLKALGLRKEGAVLVACPSCGRADVDVRGLANQVDQLRKDH